jgi:hypothetical protein
MAVLAFAMRPLLAISATTLTGTTLENWAAAADGYQYIAQARAWMGNSEEVLANPYFARLFPGASALLALLVWLGVPVLAAILAPPWIACAVSAPLSAAYFRDRRVGWAMATLTPAYLLSGALISSEALALVFSLAGLHAARSGRDALAGVCFGLAGFCRPMAIFALLGCTAAMLIERRRGSLFRLLLAASLTFSLLVTILAVRLGNPTQSAAEYTRAYGGSVLSWPFHSLVATPLTIDVATWKVFYVAAHLGAVALAAYTILRSFRHDLAGPRPGYAVEWRLWFLLHSLFVLSIGDVWGFHDFPRFLIPALPPLFFALRALLPRALVVWLALGAFSLALASIPARRLLLNPHDHPPITSGFDATATARSNG